MNGARAGDAARPRAAHRRRPLDPRPARRGARRGGRRVRRATSSARPARRSTTSRGTSSATGTWNWPRCSSPRATARGREHPGGARQRARRGAAPAAPGDPVRHRDRCGRRSPVAESVVVARLAAATGSPADAGAAQRVADTAAAGHRDPPVPQRSGAQADKQKVAARLLGLDEAGSGAAARRGGHAGPAHRTGRGLRRHRLGGGAAERRHRHRRARHLGHRRPRRRTAPAGEGPRGRAEGTGGHRRPSSATRRSWPRRPEPWSTRSGRVARSPRPRWSASGPAGRAERQVNARRRHRRAGARYGGCPARHRTVAGRPRRDGAGGGGTRQALAGNQDRAVAHPDRHPDGCAGLAAAQLSRRSTSRAPTARRR